MKRWTQLALELSNSHPPPFGEQLQQAVVTFWTQASPKSAS